jgi:hypothetical protein
MNMIKEKEKKKGFFCLIITENSYLIYEYVAIKQFDRQQSVVLVCIKF